MKKYFKLILATLLCAGFLFSCKKSSTPAPKDYTAAIKDKTWWGELTYTGKKVEFYSIAFKADNSLIWSQLSGDYPGHWVISGNELTMTFDANTARINSVISDDNKLINITDNTGYYEINSSELIVNPNIPLDKTVWKGSYYNGSSQQPLQISFSAGFGITTNFGAFPAAVYTYTRSVSGAVIRFGTGGLYPFFAVITSSSEIKGSTTTSDYPLQANKQ